MNKDLRANPEQTKGPYYVTENGSLQAVVRYVVTVLKRFEPMDVLNGETVIYDSSGRKILISTTDRNIIEKNEYPKNYEGISYEVGEVDEIFLSRLNELKKTSSLPELLD